jgi:hypothetical protein
MKLDDNELRRIAALVLLSMLIVLFGVARAYWPEDRSTIPEPEIRRTLNAAEAYVLGDGFDVNAASAEELELLPGVGPALARRIQARAPIEKIADLDALDGVGPSLYEKLKAEVVIRAPTSRATPQAVRAPK